MASAPRTLLAVMACAAVAAEEMAVDLPPGRTQLDEIGVYRVAYASYDGPTVEMPPSWVGHFEPVSGISYQPGERVLGRAAILLHTPWRVPPGKAWVDYRLQLPPTTPIQLTFSIAMRPDVTVPGKSDGVTFGCAVVDGEAESTLLSEHYTKGEWKACSFDLSRFAGHAIVLRLQAEPGPARDPSFDYSYFGDPAVQVGEGVASRAGCVERLLALPSVKAVEGIPLTTVANDSRRGVAPSSLSDCRVRVTESGGAWTLSSSGADGDLVYTIQPESGTLDDLRVRFASGSPFQPAAGGGLWAAVKDGKEERLTALRGGTLRDLRRVEPAGLVADWEYPIPGASLAVRWEFGLVGRALTLSVSSASPVIGRVWLGALGPVPLRRVLSVPYLPADWNRGTVDYLPQEHLFICRYLDWTQSGASRCPQSEAIYEPRTDGVRNPLRESGYIAVSAQLCDVLPNIPHPASPYRELLGPRLMLDIWGQPGGSFQGSAAVLRRLKDYGVDHLAIINHVWQCFGYDVKLPDHIPANAGLGGDEGMAAFGAAANACGYVWSVHENYIDLYPDAPSYDPTARVLRADGTPSPAWFNAGTGVQSYGLKCNRALGYARRNAPAVHRRYGTTAAYLDVHTCVPPWHQLDHEAGQPMAAMLQAKVRADRELFQFMRDTHAGPLFGEGHNHVYWAGLCDGVEAQVAGGEDHAPLLDFDLLKLHPQMVNHGMGYYERWFRAGYRHRFGQDTGTLEQIDKYRAQELAYGHAGFVGGAQVDNVQWVAREHHLMHPVQRLYGTARVTDVRYEVEGRLVPVGIALAAGDTCRQRITYESGLRLWVNWSPEPWAVEGRVLPTWGFLALGPDTEVHTSLRDGRVADFADCPEFLFADARTHIDMPYLKAVTDIEPRLRDLVYLGGNRLRLTYEWLVNQDLDRDYHCFVHFRNDGDTHNHGIVFQQDHELPRPTSTWRQGDVVVDGPYEVDIPADPAHADYDLVIGLHRGPRLPLKGLLEDGSIHIARLRVARDAAGQVTAVRQDSLEDVARRLSGNRADFGVRLNPPGTWIDFGAVATDGSVKVCRGPDRLTLFPYPRDRAFRVALDVGRILPGAHVDPSKVRVQALAAETAAPLGEVPVALAGGRIRLDLGRTGLGRYVLTW